MKQFFLITLMMTLSNTAFASGMINQTINLTSHWIGFAVIVIFVLAYVLVILEEKLHLRKSKPA